MEPRTKTSIVKVKLKGLIFRRDQEIYVIVNATEPRFTTAVRVSQIRERMAKRGGKKFPTHRWNDLTMIEPVARICGDEFQTAHKGTYLAIAKKFHIKEFRTLVMMDLFPK